MNIETLAAKYSAIPPHWKLSTLGESLTVIIGGGTPSRDNPSFWGGDIPWLTVKDMRRRRPTDAQEHITQQAVKESATNIIPPDTVITATRVGLGKVVRVPFAAAINQDLKALVVGPDLDKSYLEYLLVSIATFLESIGSGTTVKGIRLETLRQLPIPLAPLQEQREIVAELEKQFSRLDEAVANLQRVKANLKRYKASVLKAAVEGRLVETEAALAHREGRTYETGEQLLNGVVVERKVHRAAKGKTQDAATSVVKNLPQLADGWAWASVEEVGRLQLGRQRAPKYHAGANMRPYLRVQNVFEDRIDLSDVMEMEFSEADFERFELHSGDVLLNEGQSPEFLGRPAIYRNQLPGVCFTNTLIRFQAYRCVLPEFALVFFRHCMHSGRFAKESNITTNIAHLSLGRLATVEFPVPPLAEQQRIIFEFDRQMSIVREVEAEVAANLKRAQALRQATLSKAFQQMQ